MMGRPAGLARGLLCLPAVVEGTVHDREKGFSLVELMVAMVVTLIIAGAVFQLVTAGQSAFRKEPAVADRQQNIRVALDLIAQDVFQAGYGIPPFAQVFTDDLDGVGQMGSGGDATDEIEIFRATECPLVNVCEGNNLTSKSIVTLQQLSACYGFPTLVLFGNDNEWDMRWAKTPGQGEVGKDCSASEPPGGRHGHVALPPGQSNYNPARGFKDDFSSPPTYMLVGQAIRYRIQPDAVDGVPNLERSAFGGRDDLDGNSTWQIIARGIEDLQVEYLNAAGWQDEPGTIDCGDSGCGAPNAADYDRLIRRVRVRLSARVTESGPMAGETASVALPGIHNAIRGQLVTEVAPRPATTTIQMNAGDL